MVDVPINWGTDTGVGGSVRGNYCVWNPLAVGPNITISNGNSNASSGTNSIKGLLSTFAIGGGAKWYWEVTITALASDLRLEIGLATYQYNYASGYLSGTSNAGAAIWSGTAFGFYVNGPSVFSATVTALAVNDVVMFAYDDATGKIWVGKNGTFYNSGAPASGTGNVTTMTAGSNYLPAAMINTSGGTNAIDLNGGQRAFAYTAPTGFKALCTQNLPTPTISNGANYMAASLYTGTGASQTVSNAVNSISFQPDLVWIKSRSAATDYKLTDSVRGVTIALVSNSTAAETTDSTGLTAFGSSGFTVGANTTYNNSGATYVGWNWKGGGTAVTNTAGSITSSVSANTTAGFSVVTYTGTGANATVGHGLGVASSMVIVKKRSAAASWAVWHSSLTLGQNMFLDSTSAAYSEPTMWNSTAPTSTVFSLGTYGSGNTSSATYVAYCFAPISGYSAFGSYTGNASSDGPFVYFGFRPRYVMLKRSDTGGTNYNWFVYDSARDTYNATQNYLEVNLTSAEQTSVPVDFLSNGFKVRTASQYWNASGGTFIYAAFAENPFTISRAR